MIEKRIVKQIICSRYDRNKQLTARNSFGLFTQKATKPKIATKRMRMAIIQFRENREVRVELSMVESVLISLRPIATNANHAVEARYTTLKQRNVQILAISTGGTIF